MPETFSGASNKAQLAIVGCGVMGELMAKAVRPRYADLLLIDPKPKRLLQLQEQLGAHTSTDPAAAGSAERLLLSVKPQHLPGVLDQIGPAIGEARPLVISIVAGATTHKIGTRLPARTPIVRVMTNTPCLVGKGMSVLSANEHVTPEQLSECVTLFNTVGQTAILRESLLDAVTGLSGSGPAYFFVIVEALIEAGVLQGLPREVARELVIQTMLGSAELIRETAQHPGPLRDMVTSPGGTTIAGLQVLEEYKVRAALFKMVETATKRAQDLGKL